MNQPEERHWLIYALPSYHYVRHKQSTGLMQTVLSINRPLKAAEVDSLRFESCVGNPLQVIIGTHYLKLRSALYRKAQDAFMEIYMKTKSRSIHCIRNIIKTAINPPYFTTKHFKRTQNDKSTFGQKNEQKHSFNVQLQFPEFPQIHHSY